jgi:hypothetical protein
LDKFRDDGPEGTTEPHRVPATNVEYPAGTYDFSEPGIFRESCSAAMRYLFNRNYDSNHIHDYHLKFCPLGTYSNRIIIPVFFEGRLVSYTGRDYTGNANLRYRNCPLNKSILSPKKVLYNWDNFVEYMKYSGKKHVRLVEGPTDVWRIGRTSLGMMTNKLYTKQMSLLASLRLDSISLIFDPGSYGKGIRYSEELSPLVPSIKVVQLVDRDPSQMTEAEIFAIEENTPTVAF